MLFEEYKSAFKQGRVPTSLRALEHPKKPRYILTQQETESLPVGTTCVLDIELFPNYQLIALKVVGFDGYFYFEQSPASQINLWFLRSLLYRLKFITFNGINYDIPILEATLNGGSLEEIKQLSDAIILRKERLDFKQPKYNHIDLAEVAPLIGGLKLYAARLHCERMQEMPVNPHAPISQEQASDVKEYCFNDLDNTELLYKHLKPQIEMREAIGAAINRELRSKSDAQIAEAIIEVEYEKVTGDRPRRPKEISTKPVAYNPPAYLQFKTPQLQQTLELIKAQQFQIGAMGYADIPPALKGLKLHIGNNVFRMSIGGLHSSETKVSLQSNAEWCISDFDVASYYPKIVLNGGLYPPSMGPIFLDVFRAIVERRLNSKSLAEIAKKNGLEEDAIKFSVESDGLKITINGTFGKFGNSYSIMYSPELMLYVTLTGQLTLLLLIEHAALEGFEIVSANTDGVVFHYPRSREPEMQAIVEAWKQQSDLKMEQTAYKGYFARDVNNYMTLKENGEWKLKGAYSEKGSAQNSVLSRNPERFICIDAVKAYIADNIPIEVTIRNSSDIRRFVTVRNVTGGAHKSGVYLGKVIRWYYAEGVTDAIYRVKNGDQVANTLGAKPLMQMSEFPDDINYNFYIDEAFDILRDIGYLKDNEQRRLL